MIQENKIKSHVLVVDTNQYSGNFERQLCAYVTGQIGECGVGEEIANHYSNEITQLSWWNKHIVLEKDDSGCARPVSIWTTPGWLNNGMGFHYRDEPQYIQEAKEKAIESMKKHYAGEITRLEEKIKSKNFDTSSHGWTEKACRDTLKNMHDTIEKMVKAPLPRYSAYQSVAIFVDCPPPQKVWEEFQQRCHDFAKNRYSIESNSYYQEVIEITGFRQFEAEHTLKSGKLKK